MHKALAYDGAAQSITVKLPAAHQGAGTTGKISFYRPDDARLDRAVALALNAEAAQRVDVSTLAPGLWKVQLSWMANGEEYFLAKSIVIEPES